MPAVYDRATHTYQLDGRTYTPAQIRAMLDRFDQRQAQQAAALAQTYLRTQDAAQFNLAMQQLIKESFIANYVLAHGGRATMSMADWGRVGQQIRTQYLYLNNFIATLSTQTNAQLTARARLYAVSARRAYWTGATQAYNIQLPAQPGDGTTACRMNCRCSWRIEDQGNGEVHAYWTLGQAEHCADCVQRAQQWAPFVTFRQEVVRV